jgi:hypothetical protein
LTNFACSIYSYIMFKKHLFVLTAFTTLLFSCKKEDSVNPEGNNSQLTGTWTFINMTAHTSSTEIEEIDGDTYKTVTISDYTSIDNAGELIIGASTFATKDFTYTANTDAYATVYLNGVEDDNFSAPYYAKVPVASSQAPYKIIGTDSVYVSAGTVTTGATTVPSTPTGMKFSFAGDTLLLTSTGVVPAGAGYTGYSTQTMRYIKKS